MAISPVQLNIKAAMKALLSSPEHKRCMEGAEMALPLA